MVKNKGKLKGSKTQKVFQINKEKVTQIDKYLFWLLFMIILILPLLLRAKAIYFISPVIDPSLHSTGFNVDVYTYYKFICLLISTIIALCLFTYKIISAGYQVKKNYLNISLVILFILILFSGLISNHKSIALNGIFNRHEGTITYSCYLSLFFIAANIKYDLKMYKIIFYSLYPIILVSSFLGLYYFFGHNILDVSWIKNMIIPVGFNEYIQAGSRFASTLNNPNYVSGIFGVFSSIFLLKAILDNNLRKKVLSTIISLLSFATLLSSLSLSGFVSLILVFPFIIYVLFTMENKLSGLISGLINLLSYVMIFYILYKHNNRIWQESLGIFLDQEFNISTLGVGVFILFTIIIGISIALTTIIVKNHNNVMKYLAVGIACVVLLAIFITGNENLESLSMPNYDSQEVIAALQEDEFNLPKAGRSLGTGRVYIWAKTIELIKEKPLIGYGLDTIIYNFPQNDPLKIAGLGSYKTTVDKPHNMYLGLAYGSGLIALGAFLMMILLHYFNSLKLITKLPRNETTQFLSILFVGWCAYLIQGLFNDSIIGTAPIFWILFGISVSLTNELLLEEDKETM